MCREKAKDIVKKKGGTITEDEDEATHILFPKVELNNELYARYVFRKKIVKLEIQLKNKKLTFNGDEFNCFIIFKNKF